MSVEHTQDGPGTFPPLSWITPEGAQELLLIVEDPDAPLPQPVGHGFCYGIPASVNAIHSEDFDQNKSKDTKKGFKLGITRRGTPYAAPRPLLNHGPHRYFYQIVALKTLPLGDFVDKPSTRDVLAVLEKDDTLAWGEWVGVAERKTY